MSYNGARLLNTDMNKFYVQGTVLHSYNFYVDFKELNLPNYGIGGGKGKFRKTSISDSVWNFPQAHQVVDVDIPTYKFQRESVSYGATQFSYPILSKEQPLDFKMTFQDNVYGNVGRFVNLLQKTVVDGGVHRFIKDMKIGNIYVYIADELKNSVCCWIFRGVFFLGYENLSLAYDSNDPVKYTVTFGCDVMTYVSDNKFYGVGQKPIDITDEIAVGEAEALTRFPTEIPIGAASAGSLLNVFG